MTPEERDRHIYDIYEGIAALLGWAFLYGSLFLCCWAVLSIAEVGE